MTHRYGTFDTRTASAEFMGMPFHYGYMNHMAVNHRTNVLYVGKGHDMFKLYYDYDQTTIRIPRPNVGITTMLTRDERHVTQQVMDHLREDNRLVEYLIEAPEYTRVSEAIALTRYEIQTHLNTSSVPFDEIELSARFLDCKRMTCEYTVHNDDTQSTSHWDVELTIEDNFIVAKDPVDDNKMFCRFTGEVPSLIDMVKAYIQVFQSELYKVSLCKQN